jgi:membrane protease YdiL (CAAX protease family)
MTLSPSGPAGGSSTKRSPIAAIFVGPHGLRYGWRFLLFALAIWLAGEYLEGPLAFFLAQRLRIDPDALSAPVMIVFEGVSLAEVLLVTAIAAWLERRRIDQYGLPLSQAFRERFWKGMLAGLLMVVFVGGSMILIGAMRVAGFALRGGEVFVQGFLWLAAMILVGLSEEYLFRGYALQALWRSIGFWPAALITTGLFAAAHFSKPHENAMDIGMIFFLGLVLCLSVKRTGSLWWAVGWHAAFDFGQFFLIGTRNGGQTPVGHLLNVTFPGPAWITGGELGTEASVFMVPAAIATLVYVGWALRGKNAASGEIGGASNPG